MQRVVFIRCLDRLGGVDAGVCRLHARLPHIGRGYPHERESPRNVFGCATGYAEWRDCPRPGASHWIQIRLRARSYRRWYQVSRLASKRGCTRDSDYLYRCGFRDDSRHYQPAITTNRITNRSSTTERWSSTDTPQARSSTQMEHGYSWFHYPLFFENSETLSKASRQRIVTQVEGTCTRLAALCSAHAFILGIAAGSRAGPSAGDIVPDAKFSIGNLSNTAWKSLQHDAWSDWR